MDDDEQTDRPRRVLDRVDARMAAALAADPATPASSRAVPAVRRGRPSPAIVPARNEAALARRCRPTIVAQLRAGDELRRRRRPLDRRHGGDRAERRGDRSCRHRHSLPGGSASRTPAGRGAAATIGADAAVRRRRRAPGADLLDGIEAVIAEHPDADRVGAAVAPHRSAAYEQASLLCNVAALMGSGAFTIAGDRVHPTVAFGPVLAMRRDVYDEVGGHEAVRSMHTEDIGLARAVGGATLFTGRPDTTFRMYPDGLAPARRRLDTQHRHRCPLDPVVA